MKASDHQEMLPKGNAPGTPCNHLVCDCRVGDGLDYCAPSCRQGISDADEKQCFCGHAECSASSGEASL